MQYNAIYKVSQKKKDILNIHVKREHVYHVANNRGRRREVDKQGKEGWEGMEGRKEWRSSKGRSSWKERDEGKKGEEINKAEEGMMANKERSYRKKRMG